MQIKQKQQRLSASATKRDGATMTWRHRNALIKVREKNAGPRPDLSAIEPRRNSFEKGAYVEQENGPWDASEDVILPAI
jgi:hypothetical protein